MMRSLWLGWVAAMLLGMLSACGTRSSGYATGPRLAPYAGPVRLSALRASAASAREVGVVEVTSVESLETAAHAFSDRVGELGGNLGIVERAWMTFEMETRSRLVTYSCGTQTSPRNCSRTEYYTEEVGYLHLVGHAFLEGGYR